jgi:hypothetical protein
VPKAFLGSGVPRPCWGLVKELPDLRRRQAGPLAHLRVFPDDLGFARFRLTSARLVRAGFEATRFELLAELFARLRFGAALDFFAVFPGRFVADAALRLVAGFFERRLRAPITAPETAPITVPTTGVPTAVPTNAPATAPPRALLAVLPESPGLSSFLSSSVIWSLPSITIGDLLAFKRLYHTPLNMRLNANPRLRWRFHPCFFDLRGFANDSEGSDAKTSASAGVASAASISSLESAATPG